jgi:hypothetical protein
MMLCSIPEQTPHLVLFHSFLLFWAESKWRKFCLGKMFSETRNVRFHSLFHFREKLQQAPTETDDSNKLRGQQEEWKKKDKEKRNKMTTERKSRQREKDNRERRRQQRKKKKTERKRKQKEEDNRKKKR